MGYDAATTTSNVSAKRSSSDYSLAIKVKNSMSIEKIPSLKLQHKIINLVKNGDYKISTAAFSTLARCFTREYSHYFLHN